MPRPTGPRLAVIIPHLNQPEALRRGLTALAKGSVSPDQVIVVDNGSAVLPPADLWDACPGAKLIVAPEPGPGPARNAGVDATDAELLAFIDADCIAGQHWIARLFDAHAQTPDAVLGGDVRIGPEPPQTPSACYEAVYAFRMDRYLARQGFTGAGNMAVPRMVWDRVGPFGGLDIAEDRDWGHRAGALGVVQRFVPEMRVFHPARPDLAALGAKWDRMIAHDFARLGVGAGPRLHWIAKGLALPLSPLVELPRLAVTPRLRGGRQRALAFAGLCILRAHRARRMAQVMLRPARASQLSAGWNRA